MAELVATPGAAVAPPESRGRRPARTATTPAGWVLRLIAVAWVAVLVLVPLVIVVKRAFEPGLTAFLATFDDVDTQHAFKVTAVVAGTAVIIDVIFGVAAAILLVRYRFPGKRLLSALIDLPVAVSPIIVGLALVLVYGPQGWFGDALTDTPLQIIGAKPGMVLATVFVSLPLVVRAIEPVLVQAGTEQDQAAASLGANAVQRFWRITLPTIRIALAYGTVLAIARCLGEYGAVLVVSGNVGGETETATLRIGNLIDNDQDFDSAYAVAFVLVLVALVAIVLAAIIRRLGQPSTRRPT